MGSGHPTQGSHVMILVTGATGNVGTALVAQLQTHRLPFRALAHTPASLERLRARHVAAVLADDTQRIDLVEAFDDVDRFFLLTPSSPDQAAIEQRLVDAARHAGVRHIVKLSVLAAGDRDVSLLQPHFESEQYIRQSGMSYTFLRPNMFTQNLVRVDAPLIKQQRAIFNGAGDGAVSFVDVHDIAAVALEALRDERHIGHIYDLTGPAALFYADVARKLTALLDQPVQYIPLSDDAYRAALLSAGLPNWYADGLTELFRFYRMGNGAVVTDAVERITGRPARTVDAYLVEHRTLFE
jgi:uncharacterized protein YbjT (DUF2867 family)